MERTEEPLDGGYETPEGSVIDDNDTDSGNESPRCVQRLGVHMENAAIRKEQDERAEALEKEVYYARIVNRKLKSGLLKYKKFLNGVIEQIEKVYPKDEGRGRFALTYSNLELINKTIADCKWTFRNENAPLVQLSYGDEGNDDGDGSGGSTPNSGTIEA